MKKILVLMMTLMIGLSSAFACESIFDKYELMQAREAGTAEGAWAYQKGPSDEIVEKITGKENPTHEEVMEAAKEIIETPNQQGIQAKGNPDENKKIENMKNGLTTSGLTQEEAKASIPEDTSTNDNVDQNSETKSTKKEKMYRVSPSKNGNYYVVEHSYDDGKTWHFIDSSPDLEEANKKMEYYNNRLMD